MNGKRDSVASVRTSEGVNITNFILESAGVRAAQEIAEARHFEPSTKDWQSFTEALDQPARSKPGRKRILGEPTVLETI